MGWKEEKCVVKEQEGIGIKDHTSCMEHRGQVGVVDVGVWMVQFCPKFYRRVASKISTVLPLQKSVKIVPLYPFLGSKFKAHNSEGSRTVLL